MDVLRVLGILAGAYGLNVFLVVLLGVRPRWTIFVPGLPLVLACLWLLLYALAIAGACIIGMVYGTILAVTIIAIAVRALPELMQEAKRSPMPEADVVPRLELT